MAEASPTTGVGERVRRLVTFVVVSSRDEAVRTACRMAGVDVGAAEVIRVGSNALYRLPGGVVARVGRPGQMDLADKELRVARWLAAGGVPAVRPVSDVDQPVRTADRAVTFWHELSPHRRATLGEIAVVLRQLHRLPRPEFDLPALAPLRQLGDVARAGHLTATDRCWLRHRLGLLHRRYARLPAGLPWCLVHGDAWTGNFLTTAAGPVILDLERFAYGPPEWDLVSLAMSYVTHGTRSRREWLDFCTYYGHDVTQWTGFGVLRDIREIRKATFAVPPDLWSSAIAVQARYRLACLRGEHGPRPWRWWPSP
jgi:Phosphotransferase enzyme family